MNHHCLKWIVIGPIGTNGAIVAIGHHIGDIPFSWTFEPAHRHRMALMEPFKWRHQSPMVIVIGANGDRHWCQWQRGAPVMPLEPMDCHWDPFCRQWRQWHQWREPQIVMTLLPRSFLA